MILFLPTGCDKPDSDPVYVAPAYWKDQSLNDILPYWSKYAIDTTNGLFFCTLDKNWKPVGDETRFPSMISRHLFSYSFAYLVSGKTEYIQMADYIARYLIENCWDQLHGGWFDSLDRDGKPNASSKTTFVQVYVITGLAMYYFATRDTSVMGYIESTNDLLEMKGWDHEKGGYFDAFENDWTIKSDIKSVSSQVAPVSGYLLYLYLATRNEKYLQQARKICEVVMQHMSDPKTNWVLENFDRNWSYLPSASKEEEVNIGHNIEITWMLLRLHMIVPNQDYLLAASKLAEQVIHYGFRDSPGVWLGAVGNADRTLEGNNTYWWIHAYGNMFSLCLNRVYPDKGYFSIFEKGAAFWENRFMDYDMGDSFFSVTNTGEIQDRQKANQFKSSYHNVEHSLLNYLYLSCWVDFKPFSLFFRLDPSVTAGPFYFLPIESCESHVRALKINGQQVELKSLEDHGILLPASGVEQVEVEVQISKE